MVVLTIAWMDMGSLKYEFRHNNNIMLKSLQQMEFGTSIEL